MGKRKRRSHIEHDVDKKYIEHDATGVQVEFQLLIKWLILRKNKVHVIGRIWSIHEGLLGKYWEKPDLFKIHIYTIGKIKEVYFG